MWEFGGLAVRHDCESVVYKLESLSSEHNRPAFQRWLSSHDNRQTNKTNTALCTELHLIIISDILTLLS